MHSIKNPRNILFLCFACIFLLAGVIGHDPWKQDETYSFGIIYHFFTTHTWLVPQDAGTPFMEKPPLYYWTAVILCNLLGGVLALHNAARLASVFYVFIACFFTWKSARIILKNEEASQTALLLFLGTIGVVRHAHDMFTDVALLASATIAFYGMTLVALRNERWKEAGICLGLGPGMAFLSKGLFVPVVFGFSFSFLLITVRGMRTLNTLHTVLLAGIIATPFYLIWPMLLYHHSHALFMQWFWENNVGRFLGFSVQKLGADNEPFYIAYSALWFAFPVFPLALMAIVRRRAEWNRPGLLLPVVIAAAGLGFLLASASARALYLLPLIPAFTMLAADETAHLPQEFIDCWNKTIKLLSLLAVAALWLIWAGLLTGFNLPYVATVLPVDFVPQADQSLAILAAAAATAFLMWDHYWEENMARIWFTGIAALWIITNTLLLPWIDETKSYRPVLTQMMDYLQHSPYSDVAMNEYNLGESIAPMFEYFSPKHQLHIVNSAREAKYPLLFMVDAKSAPLLEPGWDLIWQGSRALDAKDEELRLYVRKQ